MKALICEGQNYNDYSELSIILSKLGVSELISSQAEGVDNLALIWAKHKGIIYRTRCGAQSPTIITRKTSDTWRRSNRCSHFI